MFGGPKNSSLSEFKLNIANFTLTIIKCCLLKLQCKYVNPQNNATCVDGTGEYTCMCARGFSGQFCQTKVPFCTNEFSPCENGGKCVDHFTHYTCDCVAGFSGENCTKNINDCVDHMCQVLTQPTIGRAVPVGSAVFNLTLACSKNECCQLLGTLLDTISQKPVSLTKLVCCSNKQ